MESNAMCMVVFAITMALFGCTTFATADETNELVKKTRTLPELNAKILKQSADINELIRKYDEMKAVKKEAFLVAKEQFKNLNSNFFKAYKAYSDDQTEEKRKALNDARQEIMELRRELIDMNSDKLKRMIDYIDGLSLQLFALSNSCSELAVWVEKNEKSLSNDEVMHVFDSHVKNGIKESGLLIKELLDWGHQNESLKRPLKMIIETGRAYCKLDTNSPIDNRMKQQADFLEDIVAVMILIKHDIEGIIKDDTNIITRKFFHVESVDALELEHHLLTPVFVKELEKLHKELQGLEELMPNDNEEKKGDSFQELLEEFDKLLKELKIV